jgi:predicted dehydrogenase
MTARRTGQDGGERTRDPRLRLGVAGLGAAGARHLAAALGNPAVEVVATADPDRPTGSDTHHRRTEDMLAVPGLDAVVLAVPNDIAARLARLALQHGLHTLVEKPPARSAAEFAPVLAQARAAGKVLRVAFNHRYHASLTEARQLVAQGEIGDVVSLCGVYERPWLAAPGDWRADPERAGGGILLDQGIHLLDLAAWLLGPLQPVQWTVVDSAVAGLEAEVEAELLAGHVPVSIRSSAQAPSHRFQMSLLGTRGSLRLEGLQTGSGAYAPELLHRISGEGELQTTRRFEVDVSWTEQLRGFVDHVVRGTDDGHGSPKDAGDMLRLVDRMRRPQASAPETAAAVSKVAS